MRPSLVVIVATVVIVVVVVDESTGCDKFADSHAS